MPTRRHVVNRRSAHALDRVCRSGQVRRSRLTRDASSRPASSSSRERRSALTVPNSATVWMPATFAAATPASESSIATASSGKQVEEAESAEEPGRVRLSVLDVLRTDDRTEVLLQLRSTERGLDRGTRGARHERRAGRLPLRRPARLRAPRAEWSSRRLHGQHTARILGHDLRIVAAEPGAGDLAIGEP